MKRFWGSATLACVLGGLICGALDAALTLGQRVPGLSDGRAAWLAVLGLATGGAAGLVLAIAASVVSRLAGLARLHPRDGTQCGAPVGRVLAVVFGGGLAFYDAFALFGGAKAARVPGHQVLSLLIGLGASVALSYLGRWFSRRLHVTETRASGQARPDGDLAILAALVALAAGTCWANQAVLPRLYPWFHLSLSLLFFGICVLSMRFVLALSAAKFADAQFSGRARRFTPWLAACLAGLSLVSLGLAWPRLRDSQGLRFAVYEKTLAIGRVLQPFARLASGAAVGADKKQDLAFALPPLPEGPHRPGADVVVITIDALRADHLGAYGYKRQTTPNIDALSRRGVRFEKAYTQAPHTSFAIASMLTGKYYPTIARLAPGDPQDPISGELRQYGWKTAAFYPPAVFFVDANKLRAYQDNHFFFEYVKEEFLDAHLRVDQIAKFLETEKPQRAFLWLHLFEPHEKYEAHEGFAFGRADIDRYDSEIAYADAAVGRLLAYLERHRPGAIVILAADHGEEFDEHGGRYHGSSLFEEQVRVPLIIAVPNLAPKVVSRPVELLDIAPTILGLLDLPVPARMRGTNLGPWLATPGASETRLPPAFAELRDKRMVVWGREKLICDLDWGYCAYYDLEVDPGEKYNAADAHADRVAALRQKLDAWLDDHVRLEPQLLRGQSNPAGGVIPRAIERGRLGDMGAAADLAALLMSSEPLPVRREAAELLVSLPPRKDTQPLIEAAQVVADPELADWIAIAATRLGVHAAAGRVRAALLRPVVSSTPRDLRIFAALALTYVADNTGVPVLAESLSHCDDVALCRLAIIRLGGAKDARAVSALVDHLPEVQNRREVVAALGEIGDPAAIAPLVDCLQTDDYVPVREEAARALAKIGLQRASGALLAGLAGAAKTEREGSVKTAIAVAMDSLRQAQAAAGTATATGKSRRSTPTATPGTAGSPR